MADLRTVLKSKRFPVKKTIYVSILHLRLSEGGNLNKLSLKKKAVLFNFCFHLSARPSWRIGNLLSVRGVLCWWSGDRGWDLSPGLQDARHSFWLESRSSEPQLPPSCVLGAWGGDCRWHLLPGRSGVPLSVLSCVVGQLCFVKCWDFSLFQIVRSQ